MVVNFLCSHFNGRLSPKSMTRRLIPLSHPHSMTFQHVLPLGPCTYLGHINTVPICTISLKLVVVFVSASNPLLLPLPLSLKGDPHLKTLQHKSLHHSGLSVRQSSNCPSHFFLIAYWEDVGLFVSIAHPRSRKKGVRSCRASVHNTLVHFLLSLSPIVLCSAISLSTTS